MKKPNILVVDDNRGVLTAVKLLLAPHYPQIHTLTSPVNLISTIQSEKIDILLLDMNFRAGINNGNEGLFWLNEVKTTHPQVDVILCTAYAEINLAITGIKQGASDFMVKPWDNKKLLETLENIAKKRTVATGKKKDENSIPSMFWGSSIKMQKLKQLIEKTATTDANILITGENGTGKEMLAREIHKQSHRSIQSMVSLDMGAITESLFESELFGHVKGAFTDAKMDREGKFEAANHSSLFLDEIANLPYALQAKLLASIQNRTITKVGSNQAINIDIRLICATNANLPAMVRNKEFREDLLYRINTIKIEIPPLRERKEDISELAQLFITKYSKRYNRQCIELSETAKTTLLSHTWPGNIRELQHTIEKAVIVSEGKIIEGKDLDIDHSMTVETEECQAKTLEDMEYQMIKQSITKNQGNLSIVASELGISRQTLYNKIKKYEL